MSWGGGAGGRGREDPTATPPPPDNAENLERHQMKRQFPMAGNNLPLYIHLQTNVYGI